MLESEEKQGYVLQLIPTALELCLLVANACFTFMQNTQFRAFFFQSIPIIQMLADVPRDE